MSALEHSILFGTTNLSILIAAVGIVVFIFLRWKDLGEVPERMGKVKIDRFKFPELIGAIVFVLLISALVEASGPAADAEVGDPVQVEEEVVTAEEEGTESPEEEPSMTAKTVLASQVVTFFFLGLLLAFLFARGHNMILLFGLNRHKPRPLLQLSIGFFLISVTITFISLWIWQSFILTGELKESEPQAAIQKLLNDPTPGFVIALILTACVGAPLVEEVVFRGFLYPVFKRFSPTIVAAVASSGLFAVMHMNVASLGPLWVLSLLLVVAYEKTGNLLVPILVHAGFNAIMIGLTLLPLMDGTG